MSNDEKILFAFASHVNQADTDFGISVTGIWNTRFTELQHTRTLIYRLSF